MRSDEILGISHGARGLLGHGTTSPLRHVASPYEKGLRRYPRGRGARRDVRSDLGAAGIRSAWWQPDEQHHDLVRHWPDHGADRHRDRGIQLAETLVEIVLHVSATVKSTVCQPVAPSGTVPT